LKYRGVGGGVVTPWFYNRSMFAEAGLDPERVPETFAEWIGKCEDKLRRIP